MKKQQRSSDHRQEQSHRRTCPPFSEFSEDYLREVPPLDQQYKNFFQTNLNINGFQKLSEFSELTNTTIKANQNSLLFQVRYGYYKTYISVFICDFRLKNMERYYLNKGNDGKVYIYKQRIQDNSRVVAKQFFLPKDDNKSQIEFQFLKRYLKEIFMAKFASALQVGPRFCKNLTYDMIVIDQSILFLMENCSFPINVVEKDESKIKKLLSILHSFGFIHNDIKPANMGWSQMQQKLIFLDFGLSDLVKQKVGEKTSTCFKGTFFYSGKQMKAAYKLNSVMPVDLYYNDLFSLNKTVNFFKETLCLQRNKNNQRCQHDLSQSPLIKFQNYFRLRYYMFMDEKQKIRKIIEEEKTFIYSFDFIINQSLKSSLEKSSLREELKSAKSSESQQQRKADFLSSKTLDSTLYIALQQTRSIDCSLFWNVSYENIYLLLKQKNGKKIWMNDRWMEKLFLFMYAQQPQYIQFFVFDLEIIRELCEIELEECPHESRQQCYIFILDKFQKYFISKKSVRLLQMIFMIYRELFLYVEAKQLCGHINKIVCDSSSDKDFLDYLQSFLEERILLKTLRDFYFSWQEQLVKKKQKFIRGVFSKNCLDLMEEVINIENRISYSDRVSLKRYTLLITELLEKCHKLEGKYSYLEIILFNLPRQLVYSTKQQLEMPIQIEGDFLNELPVTIFISGSHPNVLRTNIQFMKKKYCQTLTNGKQLQIFISKLLKNNSTLLKNKSMWSFPLYKINKQLCSDQIVFEFLNRVKAAPFKEAIFYLVLFLSLISTTLQNPKNQNAFIYLIKGMNFSVSKGNIWWAQEWLSIIQQMTRMKSYLQHRFEQASKAVGSLLKKLIESASDYKKQNPYNFPQIADFIGRLHTSDESQIVQIMKDFNKLAGKQRYLTVFYENLSFLFDSLQEKYHEYIEEVIWEEFHGLSSNYHINTLLNISVVADSTIKIFAQKRLWKQSLQFLLRLGTNKCYKFYHLFQEKAYKCFYSIDSIKIIEEFGRGLIKQKLEAMKNNRLTPYLLPQIISLCSQSLQIGIQKRLIRFICLGIQFIQEASFRQKFKGFILRWRRKSQICQNLRKNMNNLKKQGQIRYKAKIVSMWVVRSMKLFSRHPGSSKVSQTLNMKFGEWNQNILKQYDFSIDNLEQIAQKKQL